METASLCLSMLTLYIGMLYLTEVEKKEVYMEREGLEWFFFVVFLIPNLAFYLYWLYKVYIECLKLLMKKNRVFWFKLCTCFSISIDKFLMKTNKERANRKQPYLVESDASPKVQGESRN